MLRFPRYQSEIVNAEKYFVCSGKLMVADRGCLGDNYI